MLPNAYRCGVWQHLKDWSKVHQIRNLSRENGDIAKEVGEEAQNNDKEIIEA